MKPVLPPLPALVPQLTAPIHLPRPPPRQTPCPPRAWTAGGAKDWAPNENRWADFNRLAGGRLRRNFPFLKGSAIYSIFFVCCLVSYVFLSDRLSAVFLFYMLNSLGTHSGQSPQLVQASFFSSFFAGSIVTVEGRGVIEAVNTDHRYFPFS